MLHSPKNNLNLKIKTGTVTAPENVIHKRKEGILYNTMSVMPAERISSTRGRKECCSIIRLLKCYAY